ncbi:MAG: winged helix-turn-helix domain-containing protein [Candidatus Baltobacteraceae bacterium]
MPLCCRCFKSPRTGEHKLNDLVALIADRLNLSEPERLEKMASGQSRFRNRVYWAKLYLNQAKAIETIRPGIFSITERGRSLLAQNGERIAVDALMQFSEFRAFKAKSGTGTHNVRRADKYVTVTVPEDPGEDGYVEILARTDVRESHQIQALLADIGSRMGMQIWLPRNDRTSVLGEWKGDHPGPLDRLPLNYDEATLKTIEQIDVLWLRGRSIRRAFEVEHTTAVYSGILRMADLLALQPNMDIKLHIVAPPARRDKVFQELRRPVFSLLERGALFEYCTYLSYDSVRDLREQPLLAHLNEAVLDDYAEEAEDPNA